jgi:CRP-like cAMP-binding protein
MKKLLEKSEFTQAEVTEFMSNALVIQCPKKTVLLKEGDVSRFFYFITKGSFRAGFTDANGTEHTRAFFSYDINPILMSYGSFINQTPSLSFLDTIEDGEVLSWTYDYMYNLQETNFKWLKLLKRQLDAVFSTREIKEWQVYTLSAEARYLAFFEQSPELASRIPLHYIASYIGITPEALSRIRGRLAKKK